MDAFYVSVEIRDNPALANKPVAVGGKSERRGVLSTCNYIARKYGLSSAMPTALALKKCPELMVLPGRMQVYKEVSQTIRAIFERYTDKIEPLSLDEAYLDLSRANMHQGSATLIAREIRHEIYKATGLTASAGIAPLKFLAKIASDFNKPNGQYTIAPEQVLSFLENLPLNKIPGVGKVTFEKLNRLGFQTCSDIRRSEEKVLVKNFGKYGHLLWQRCHGIDGRELQTFRIRKSVGVEQTFEHDKHHYDDLALLMSDKLIPELNLRCEKHLKGRIINKLGVKVKFNDFQQTTKEQKCAQIDNQLLHSLLAQALARGNGKPVRLLGVHIGLGEQQAASPQLGFDFVQDNQPG
jgi:DNA polymerase-4